MTDIFLSYSSGDRAIAERIQKALAARGLDVFWDQTIPPGQDWDTWIRTRLQDSRLVVVLWSKASVQSPNVRHEAMVARDAGKLLPVMTAQLNAEDFPMGLYLVQALSVGDARDPDAPAMRRLFSEIEDRLQRAPEARPRARKPKTLQRMVIWSAAVMAVLGLAASAAVLWGDLPSRFGVPTDASTDVALETATPPFTQPVSPAQPAPTAGDPCEQVRSDWDAVKNSQSRAAITAFLEAAPAACGVQRALAETALASMDASARAARDRKAAEWNGVPGLEGDWILDAGGCLELPWRFQPVDLRLKRTLSSGATDMWAVHSTNPQAIAWSDGSTMTLEGNTLRYVDGEGKLNCTLKRR